MNIFIEAIKDILLRDKWLQEQFHSSDCGKKWAIRHSAGTTAIANSLEISQSQARYQLNKLHKQGLLLKHKWPGGHCAWFPADWGYK